MTDADIERAARRLCEIRGLDAELYGALAIVADEVRAFLEVQQAVAEPVRPVDREALIEIWKKLAEMDMEEKVRKGRHGGLTGITE